MRELSIHKRLIGPNHPPYVIAELSANHNGSLQTALDTIKSAKQQGADAVKFQTYTPDTLTIDCDRNEFLIKQGLWRGRKLYDLYSEAYTPFEWHRELFDYAKELGMTAISTPFDETAVDLLEELQCPAYKVASFEATDLPLVNYIAQTGKPMIISTGMANLEEISEVVATAKQGGCEDIVLLHCISGYPTPVEQANLATIQNLHERFQCVVGLSDHTTSSAVAIAAVALGACVIEKHFILSRAMGGPDSSFSIEPEELKQLIVGVQDAYQAVGQVSYERAVAEQDNLVFRRSIFFVEALPEGATITSQHVRRIRPGYGLPPKYIDQVIGKKTTRAVARGQPVSWEDLTDS